MDDQDLMALMVMHTIGLSIIYSEFKRAAWSYFKPHYHPKTSSDSLAFIQGTGLEIVVHTYGLQYDPDYLRNTFYSMVGDHAKITDIRNSVSSPGGTYRRSPRYSTDEQNGRQIFD